MITLLRNLGGASSLIGGFDKLPGSLETTPGADLARIKYYRNTFAYMNRAKIKTVDFNLCGQICLRSVLTNPKRN